MADVLMETNSLTLLVNPKQVRVYDTFEDEDSITIIVKNKTSVPITGLLMELTIPKDIVLSIDDNDDIREAYSMNFMLEPNGEKVIYVFPTNESETDATENLHIRIVTGTGNLEGDAILHILT